jgi:two-component system phosphate regulon sensor histidine kinase PhoR
MKKHPDPSAVTATDSGIGGADHSAVIGRSLYVHIRVRSLVVVAIVAATVFARYVLRMQRLDVGAFTVLAVCIALYNCAAWVFFRRSQDPEASVATYPRLLAVTYGAVILDFLSLTAAVWLVGGGRSPFTTFYLLHVMVSCILLSRRAAIALSALAYSLFVLLVVVEWSGAAAPPLRVGAAAGEGPLTGIYALTIVIIYGMFFSLSVFLLLGLTRSLRSVERRILLANDELRRLSQQRKDFLHIASHNLRAPVGAVSMLLENMREGAAGAITEKQRDWLDRSLKRLGDLTEFMINIQTLSLLETDIINTQFTSVDLARVVTRLVNDYTDVAESHRHTLRLEIPEAVPRVVGHERLLQEALVNYITNAINYTPDGGRIVVRLLYQAEMVRVEVTDNGIGIAKEAQARLFQEFVQIPGHKGAAAGPKGSGLGLSIVRRIVLAHGGRTGVESEIGKGSTFFVELPALHE